MKTSKYGIIIFILSFVPTAIFANSLNLVAEGAILIDVETGIVLYGKNEYETFYPASTTKVLSSVLFLNEMVDPYAHVTQTQSSKNIVPADSSNIGLLVGDTYTYLDGIHAVLLASDNFVTHDMAVYATGSIEAFSQKMNNLATSLGATGSNFTNPHGYHDPDHYTTAYDLALITRYAFAHPTIRTIASKTTYDFTRLNASQILSLKNSSALIHSDREYYNENVIASKTGYHTPAGLTLVAQADYDNISLVAVVLKSTSGNQYVDINKLFEYGSTNFENFEVDGEIYLRNISNSDWSLPYITAASKLGFIKATTDLYNAPTTGKDFATLLQNTLGINIFLDDTSPLSQANSILTGDYAAQIIRDLNLPNDILTGPLYHIERARNILAQDVLTYEDTIYLAYQLYIYSSFAQNTNITNPYFYEIIA
ncbi:MAG: hypothetical protein ATN35_02760 [Epulopiscium sp. Nele67-Bin004]|nr:MAG: hypothetical protein ATN35_02760 [Epulopiscium sp. Nele67-Bin004]